MGGRLLSAGMGWLALLLLVAGPPLLAQEGHPLKGSWIGEWEGNQAHGNHVLLVLDWDGENITGIINPGTDNIPIRSASLDPSNWGVRIEAQAAAGASGGTLDYVIEGTIEDLAMPNRYIAGTWRNQNQRGRFQVRRQ